jgi:hypothetical protein
VTRPRTRPRRRANGAVLAAAAAALLAAPGCRALGIGAGDGGADADTPLIGDLDLKDLFGAAQGEQVVADENLKVAARSWRGPGFTLPSPRSVHVTADGKEHTDKGFRLYVMSTDDLAKFQKHQAFKDVPSFEGLKVHALDKTDTLPAGSWCVVVYNSENAARAMVVHLKVVVAPA